LDAPGRRILRSWRIHSSPKIFSLNLVSIVLCIEALPKEIKKRGGNKKMKRKNMMSLITIVAVVAVAISAGCNGPLPPPPPPPPSPPSETPTPPPQQLPDLSIAFVEIYPSEPQAGERFTAAVYVANIGNAPSGEYDLAMHVRDVSRDSTYPVGTFRQSPLQPGEQVVAWSSDQLMVNEPGAHQFLVEMEPINFNDGNEKNNMCGRTFTVLS
jgi:hypothetical protein